VEPDHELELEHGRYDDEAGIFIDELSRVLSTLWVEFDGIKTIVKHVINMSIIITRDERQTNHRFSQVL